MADKLVKKNKYKVIDWYTNKEGKRKRLTKSTKLFTKEGGLNKEAIKVLAKKKGIDEFELQEQVKYNRFAGQKTNVNSVINAYLGSKVIRFLSNFGIEIEELVKDLQLNGIDVDESWVSNEAHWTVKGVYKIDGPLLLPNGQKVYFVWDYNDGAYWEIQ